jgi:hypothetical protein
MARGIPTVSGEDLGLSAGGFTNEDGNVGVVALHGRIRSSDE